MHNPIIGIVYGDPGLGKSATCLAFMPNAFVLGKASATAEVARTTYSFNTNCWPTFNTIAANTSCPVIDLLVTHKAVVMPLMQKLTPITPKSLPTTVTTLDDLIKVVEFFAYLLEAGKDIIKEKRLRPQFILDDFQNAITGALSDNGDLALEQRYGAIKSSNGDFRKHLLRLAHYADILITCHEAPAVEKTAKRAAIIGCPVIGSKTERGLIGDSEFTLRAVKAVKGSQWFDPFEQANGGLRTELQSVDARQDYIYKNRWGHQWILPPSLRAMAIASNRTDLCLRPPKLEFIDQIMYETARLTTEAAADEPGIGDAIIKSVYDRMVIKAEVKKFFPSSIKDQVPAGQTGNFAAMNWIRWGMQEGYALAIYQKRQQNIAKANAALLTFD